MSQNEKKAKKSNGRDIQFGPEVKPWINTLSEAAFIKGGMTVTPPSENPCNVYPSVPGITCHYFQLPSKGLTPEQREKALSQLEKYQSTYKARFLGYQVNQDLQFEEPLKQYLDYHINNVGDAFESGYFMCNSKWMERGVLDYYASLWNAKWPHDPKDGESYWGYVLTMGSTEGNINGLWNARDYLSGKMLLEEPDEVTGQRRLLYAQPIPPKEKVNAYTPIAFYSEDTHYSVIKCMRVLDIKTFFEVGSKLYPDDNPLAPGEDWPKEVPSKDGSTGPGSIDIDALCKLVDFFAEKGYPILVNFNYGTTFKGAYDNVEEASERLLPILKKHGLDERKVKYEVINGEGEERWDTRTGYWFHVDGALGAAYMPFIEMAYNAGKIKQRGPNFDFRIPTVHSVIMSGHKWPGAPWPCGIYMSKTKYQIYPRDNPAYLGSPDSTFAGSRNGFSPMILWDYLSRYSYDMQIEKALDTENIGKYAYQKLLALERTLKEKDPKLDLWIQRTPLALTILFKRPNPDIVQKYSMSCESLMVKDEERDYAHIYMMQHVTPELIDELIEDLSQPGAFPEQEKPLKKKKDEKYHVSKDAVNLIHVPHTGRGFK
jgi:histidine decarboxylase